MQLPIVKISPVSKVVFFGFSPIVADIVERLDRDAFDLVVVADEVQAARDVGAGRDLSSLVDRSHVRSIVSNEVVAPAVLDELGEMSATLAVSVGAPWFFTAEFIEGQLRRQIVNLHGTRLPKDRGGAIFSWQILRGQRTGLCLLHRLTERIDAGEVIDFEEFIYPPGLRTPAQLMHLYNQRNADFVVRFLERARTSGVTLSGGLLPEYLSSYWPRLSAPVNGWIDWSWNVQDLERFVCAFDDPYAGARTLHDGREVVLRDAYSQSVDGRSHPYQRGIVFRKNGQWITVAGNDGELLVCSVTDMDGADVTARIKVGDRFTTPVERLQDGLTRPRRR